MTEIKFNESIAELKERYDLPGEISEIRRIETGHINDTFYVKTSDGENDMEYVFQRVNSYVFHKPVQIMENIKNVCRHLAKKKAEGTEIDCSIVEFVEDASGNNYVEDEDGNFWRIMYYVKNSVSYDKVENPEILRSAGYAFGSFQKLLADMPMELLHETIPDFHNTRQRLDNLAKSVKEDAAGRAKGLEREIGFFEEHRSTFVKLIEQLEEGTLPLRATHNDTKYNNILIDKDTGKPICVIDLDTIMPGLSVYDFGDAMRFAANFAAEDEKDLSKVGIDLALFEVFTDGFISAAGDILTENEIANMALGAITMTAECGSRFLADYLDGDKYFKIAYPEHNLVRARCQIRLAEDMLAHYDEMCAIVNKYAVK